MALVTRFYLFTGALLLLGACTHQPPKPPEHDHIVMPAAPAAPETSAAPTDTAGLGKVATPSLTMPREWQHHNGEDYDDLFEEKLELLLQLRDETYVKWSGKHRPALTGQGVFPRPVQEKLPVWLGVGGTPASFHSRRGFVLGLPHPFRGLRDRARREMSP